jgi:hypothetical protein
LIRYEDPSVGRVRLHFPRAGLTSNRRRKPPKGLRPRANAALTNSGKLCLPTTAGEFAMSKFDSRRLSPNQEARTHFVRC